MRAFILTISLIFLTTTFGFSQCSFDLRSTELEKTVLKGYEVLKSYRVDTKDGQHKQIEYIAVLSPNYAYKLVLDSKPEKNRNNSLIVRLLDKNKKIISTNKTNKGLTKSISFAIPQAGVYYIHFTYRDNKPQCGFAVLGRKEK